MILSPNSTLKEDGIEIKQFYRPLQKEEKPIKIKVFLFNTFKLTSFTSFGEFLCRRMKNEEMPTSTFVVDKFNIWQNTPLEKFISVVLCGTASFNLGAKFINYLLNKYKLNSNQIFLNFDASDFIGQIKNVTVHKIDVWNFIDEELKIKPKVTADLYRNGKWNEGEGFIEKVKVKVNIGKLKYRIFTRDQWSDWVSNGEEIGIENYYIKGFQFQYVDDKYTLFYQCKLNNKYTNFKEVCKDKEFKSYIQDLKFEIREVN